MVLTKISILEFKWLGGIIMSNVKRSAADTSGLRKHAEEKIASQSVATETDSICMHEKLMLNELQVYKIELEIQNDELRNCLNRMEKQEAHLQNIIKDSPAGYFHINLEGNFVEVNNAWLRIHGYDSADEVLGKNFSITQIESQFEAATKHLADLHSGIASPLGEFSHLRKDGSVGYHKFSAHPVLNSGKLVGLEWFIIDTSERKKNEDEKILLQQQFQQAQKMESVGRLAGGVAHDFNNLLTVILGCAELSLLQSNLPHPLHEFLTTIQIAAKKSADLTQQLLAFARKQTIEPKVLDLNETLIGMLKMLQRLIGEDINLTWQLEAELWSVNADPSQIDQILANLCVNARDSIADIGNIVIKTQNCTIDEQYCALHANSDPGEYVCLSVSDSGCGMDKETLDHIFEPFFTTKEIGKGTGLGLATVYGVVKQNSGLIEVDSQPGSGTTFTIYLPRYVGKNEKSLNVSSAVLAMQGHETILLVEDEPDILHITSIILSNLGYTVLSANSSSEAIRIAKEHAAEIQLLLTDVVMPEENGADLSKKLLLQFPRIKTLYMSGYTIDAIAKHGVLNAGIHFIRKPFTVTNLAVKVRELLDS
jgi:PAS domain S-box-containing protein